MYHILTRERAKILPKQNNIRPIELPSVFPSRLLAAQVSLMCCLKVFLCSGYPLTVLPPTRCLVANPVKTEPLVVSMHAVTRGLNCKIAHNIGQPIGVWVEVCNGLL